MAKRFCGLSGGRVMDERLAPDYLRQMTRRCGAATPIQIVSIAVAFAAPRVAVAMALLSVAFFLLPQPKPPLQAAEEPSRRQKSNE